MKNTENAAVILPIKKMLEKAHPNFLKHYEGVQIVKIWKEKQSKFKSRLQ